jgi:hypothetical protein
LLKCRHVDAAQLAFEAAGGEVQQPTQEQQQLILQQQQQAVAASEWHVSKASSLYAIQLPRFTTVMLCFVHITKLLVLLVEVRIVMVKCPAYLK